MILELAELRAGLPPGGRLLGLDLGSKTIGLAISDPLLQIASPLETLPRGKFRKDAERLAALATQRGVAGLVLGLPRNMDGSEGPRCQSTRSFANNLANAADLFGAEPRIAFWDERLSTSAVQRFMVEEADLSRARRAKSVDAMAAAWILQGALDSLQGG